ncbi:MAG: transcription-repair coupling factor [Clostridia bacterium]|nr:transcription-repair coupling factor [Clostridia bacterium]
MNYLVNSLLEITEYSDIIKGFKNSPSHINLNGPSESGRVHICSSLCEHLERKGIFIAFNEMQARKMYEDFAFLFGDEVIFFPNKEIMLHDIEAKSYDEVMERIKSMDRVLEGNYKLVVTSVEALAHKLIPVEEFSAMKLEFSLGSRVNLEDISKQLVGMGYERANVVEAKGQFAIRGGIFDVYSVNGDDPIRIELFDDEIDSIRSFDILTQRSIDRLERAKVLPAREIIYQPQKLGRIISDIENDLTEFLKKIKNNKDQAAHIKEKIHYAVEKLSAESHFAGMDKFIPYVIHNPSSFMDYAKDAVLFVDEPVRFKSRLENLLLEHQETCKALLEKGSILPRSFEIFFTPEELENKMGQRSVINLSSFPLGGSERNYSIPYKSMSSYQGNVELLMEDLKHWKEQRKKVVILSGTRGRGERLQESLAAKDLETVYMDDAPPKILPGQVVITHGSLQKGFEYPSIGFVVVSDKEVFGQDRKIRKPSSKKRGDKIKAFSDLAIGDYVVHQAHGIGQYVGIQKLSIDNIKKDYLKIKYQADGFLYIPTNQLDLIQKYIGTDGKIPKLNKLGGTEWAKTKSKVKESLKELAGELLKLYAKRQSLKGYAYHGDTVWQKQFEEMFPYQETEDQLKCIEEVKGDMESERPMDRLLCGDVGYGKTEVAIRAVFKAVMDGKQAAYLVPTTVLAQQHYNNFKQRMKDFPVSVDVLSRFRTRSEQMRILKDVKSGVIDVLIGTHRLIQKDIQFKDLGLLIIDEEQRFGVSHKEKLKNVKPNVDVLTLTATPIPRTLHMSLVGIRDISTLEDPPEERYPVQTYVMEYSADMIRDAITREMGRKGQVFYLYNRVRTIDLKASELQAMVPEARIAIAHGQMGEGQLEDIMADFIEGKYDILVCTTIIESGLDMPNVNTIIVEDADKMGLAQLYQLKGRVGRSNRLAYAYITYKKDKILSEVAEKRLSAIKEFTEFGSGFKIAMRDLEIRGAGNLLGPQQHGQMESVGYDMYCKLLDEAVRELKGEAPDPDSEEITIDIQVNAYIDDAYINSESQKIAMYKKIASIADEQDVMDILDELLDRYGETPDPVNNLIQIAYIKSLARDLGFISVQEKNQSIILQYKDNSYVNIGIFGPLLAKYGRKILFTASNNPYITYKIQDVKRDKLIENIKILLQDLKKLQENK